MLRLLLGQTEQGLPELRILGDPLWVIAFTSDEVNIYEVMAQMAKKGWSLNGLHHPPAVHIAVTLRHTEPGVAEGFLEDLRASVDAARAAGSEPQTGSAPIYGMAATFPVRREVGELLRRYIDKFLGRSAAGSAARGPGIRTCDRILDARVLKVHDHHFFEGILRPGEVYVEAGAYEGLFLQASGLYDPRCTYHLIK